MSFNFNGDRAPKRPENVHQSDTDFSSSVNSVPRPSGDSQSKNSGFQNHPERKSNTTSEVKPSNTPVSTGYKPSIKGPHRPSARRTTAGFSDFSIPWKIVLPIIILFIVLTICWIYRDAITSFLTQLLTWVIIIVVIIFLIRWFILPGGRRRK